MTDNAYRQEPDAQAKAKPEAKSKAKKGLTTTEWMIANLKANLKAKQPKK